MVCLVCWEGAGLCCNQTCILPAGVLNSNLTKKTLLQAFYQGWRRSQAAKRWAAEEVPLNVMICHKVWKYTSMKSLYYCFVSPNHVHGGLICLLQDNDMKLQLLYTVLRVQTSSGILRWVNRSSNYSELFIAISADTVEKWKKILNENSK